MTLEQYIRELTTAKENIPRLVDEYIEKHSRYMVGQVKSRFKRFGMDGSGALIGGGKYSERTVKRKKALGQRTDHVTLSDTNKWQDGLFASYHNGDLILESRNKNLTAKLVDGEGKWFLGYGEEIMNFTQQELDLFQDMILRDLAEYLQSKFNTDINIEI